MGDGGGAGGKAGKAGEDEFVDAGKNSKRQEEDGEKKVKAAPEERDKFSEHPRCHYCSCC